MSNRQFYLLVMLTITAGNLGELVGRMVANWHSTAEVERVERHGRFLDEAKATLDARRRGERAAPSGRPTVASEA